MPNPILATKLFLPPRRPGLVTRPDLLARLDAGLERRLTLLSAPAGTGKTTLLSDWLAQPGGPGGTAAAPAPRVGWLALDAGDNDLPRFLAYLVAALRLGPELRALLNAPQLPAIESFLTLSINELADRPGRTVLALDDYQVITSQAVHDALAFLLDHQPASLHLVIASRIDPPLPLARLRARGQISELRIADLRFTPAQAADFLQRLMGVPISQAQAASLNDRVEGWAAGLQLAGLSLRDRSPLGLERFIAGFSGRQHFVFDYLADEVLSRQTPEVQTFLQRTAILDRLCGPLCDAVIGINESTNQRIGESRSTPFTDSPFADSQSLLEHLDHANLFLVPLDDEQRWYRYHHLFRELLLARLAEAGPEVAVELHRRAGRWLGQNGFLSEAMAHGLAAGDHLYVAEAIEQAFRGMTGWTDIGYGRFLRWIAALPPELVKPRWMLRLLATRMMYVHGDTHAALDALAELETDLRTASDAAAQAVLALIPTDRASYALLRGELAAAVAFGRRLLADLSPDNHIGRARALAVAAMAELRQGQVAAADADFAQAVEEAEHSQAPFVAIPFLCSQAEIKLIQGRLHEARELNQRALELSQAGGRDLPVGGFGHVGLAKLLYERNDLAAAAESACMGLNRLSQGGITEAFGAGHGVLALIQQASGDAAAASASAGMALHLAQASGLARPISEAGAYRARVWLAQGQIARAAAWPVELARLDAGETLREFEELTVARILLAQGQARQALALLQRLETAARAAGRLGRSLEALALRSLALAAANEPAAALAALEAALQQAEPEGYVRLFLDAGPGMSELLQQLAGRPSVGAYARRLLGSHQSAQADFVVVAATSSRPASNRPTPTLPEPPSERELQVLRLLASDLTAPEIAARLVVAPSTVRSHIKHLYEILNAHSRFEAVQRARQLGLI